MPMLQTLVQRSHPQVGLTARKRPYMQMIERWVKFVNRLSVVDQHTALFCPNQQMSARSRKDRRKRTRLRISRIDPAESFSVEGQDSLIRGCQDQLRLAHIGKLSHFHRNERRARKVGPSRELTQKSAVRIVLRKARGSGDVQTVLEPRQPLENFRGPDWFEANVLGRSVRPESKFKLALGLQFLFGNLKRLRSFPDGDCAHQCGCQNCGSHHPLPLPDRDHASSWTCALLTELHAVQPFAGAVPIAIVAVWIGFVRM